MDFCSGADTNLPDRLPRYRAAFRGLRQVAGPLIVRTQAQTPEAILAPKRIAKAELAGCAEAGAAMAAGLKMGIF
jgi:hypothetical protein